FAAYMFIIDWILNRDVVISFSSMMVLPPPSSTLFPYTTLFRSNEQLHRWALSTITCFPNGDAVKSFMKLLAPPVPSILVLEAIWICCFGADDHGTNQLPF